jgi:SPX domain protein involved in polyphosphate accumulation
MMKFIFVIIERKDRKMNYEELDKLLKQYKSKIYYENNEDTINKILIMYKLYNAELEAKVYTYEKIIANSNFRSVLSKDKQSLEKRIKELEQE